MKRRGIILSVIGIILVSSLLFVLVNKNTKKTFMQDGVLFALTVDGESVTSFPTNTNYRVEISCKNGKGIWLSEEWKFAIEDIAGNVTCNIDFTTRSDTDKLKNIVELKATEVDDAIITVDNSTFTPSTTLSESDYTITTMETTSDSKNAFIWDSSASTWTSQNHTHSTTSGVGMTFTVPEGYYQLCYTMGSEKNYDYGIVYIDGTKKFETKGKDTNTYCEYLGKITTSNEIKVTYRKDSSSSTSPDNIVFYLQSGTYVEDIDTETFDTGYRYTGKQPNNWIWFNNEMWRIIGSVPVCMNADCSTKENLVKIIRAESIGGLAFHSAGSNTTWGNNTLYTLLNTKYYGKLDATGASPCFGYSSSGYALCNYTENGISSDTSDYYSRMIKEVYWNVGTVSSKDRTIAAAYGLETATVSSVSGRIGLMSASDYGYASGQTTAGLSSLDSYEQTNWLYGQGYESTLTPYSAFSVMYVNYNGSVNSYTASVGHAVRPVLYLDSSVYVVSGDGSISNPYTLGM